MDHLYDLFPLPAQRLGPYQVPGTEVCKDKPLHMREVPLNEGKHGSTGLTLVVKYLGWVDLDLGCSTILLGQ